MNFLKKNWASVTMFITFTVLAVSLTIHSYNQPLEYDEYRAKYQELDAEYDKSIREGNSLIERLGNTVTVEGFTKDCPMNVARNYPKPHSAQSASQLAEVYIHNPEPSIH